MIRSMLADPALAPPAAASGAWLVYHSHPLAEPVRRMFPPGTSIAQMLCSGLVSPRPGQPVQVFYEGERIDRSRVWQVVPEPGHLVEVTHRPGWEAIVIIFTFFTEVLIGVGVPAGIAKVGAAILTAGVVVGTSFGVSALTQSLIGAPESPDSEGLSSPQQPSILTGSRNTLSPGAPVWDLLGTFEFAPPFVARPFTRVEGNKQFLRVLFGWYGPSDVDVASFKLDETPLADFAEVTELEVVEGNPGEGPPAFFPTSVFSEAPTGDGHTFEARFGHSRLVYHTLESEADELQFDVLFVSGLLRINDHGRRRQHLTQFVFDFAPAGLDPEDPSIWLSAVDQPGFHVEGPNASVKGRVVDFRAATSSPLWATVRCLTPRRGTYQVRVQMLDVVGRTHYTPDRGGSGKKAVAVFGDALWQSVKAIQHEPPVDFSPGMTFIGFQIRASDQLNAVIDTFRLRATRKVPKYTGVWGAPEPTRNPAWIALHVARGNATDDPWQDHEIHFPSWQSFATYCEPSPGIYRHTWDEVVTSRVGRRSHIQQILASCNAALVKIENKWGVVVDRERHGPVQAWAPRNIVQGSMRVTRRFDRPPEVLRFRHRSEDDGFKPATVMVYGDGFAKFSVDVQAAFDIDAAASELRRRDGGDFRADRVVAGGWCTLSGFPSPANNALFFVREVRSSSAQTAANQTLTIDKTGAPAGQAFIDRLAGDFVADGFLVGQHVKLQGLDVANPAFQPPPIDSLENPFAIDLDGIGFFPAIHTEHVPFNALIAPVPWLVVGVAAGRLTLADPDDVLQDTAGDGDESAAATGRNDVLELADPSAVLVTESAAAGRLEMTRARTSERFEAPGKVRPQEVWRMGRFIYAHARFRPRVFEWRAGIEHLRCTFGSLCNLQHDVPLIGIAAGRVTVATPPRTIVLDVDTDPQIGTAYEVEVRRADGSILLVGIDVTQTLAERVSQSQPRLLYFDSDVPAAQFPEAGERRDLVLFGEATAVKVPVVITRIEHAGGMFARLTAVDHGVQVGGKLWDVDAEPLPTFDPRLTPPQRVELVPPPVPVIVRPPGGRKVSFARVGFSPEGEPIVTVRVTLRAQESAVQTGFYHAQWRLDGEPGWRDLPLVPAEVGAVEFGPIVDDDAVVDFRVQAVSTGINGFPGVTSDYVTLTSVEVVGDIPAPRRLRLVVAMRDTDSNGQPQPVILVRVTPDRVLRTSTVVGFHVRWRLQRATSPTIAATARAPRSRFRGQSLGRADTAELAQSVGADGPEEPWRTLEVPNVHRPFALPVNELGVYEVEVREIDSLGAVSQPRRAEIDVSVEQVFRVLFVSSLRLESAPARGDFQITWEISADLAGTEIGESIFSRRRLRRTRRGRTRAATRRIPIRNDPVLDVFVVTVRDADTRQIRRELETEFQTAVYTFDDNLQDAAAGEDPQHDLFFDVRMRGRDGTLSQPARLRATNQRPAKVTVTNPGPRAPNFIALRASGADEEDVQGYLWWIATAALDPLVTPPTQRGGEAILYEAAPGTRYHVYAAAFDRFSEDPAELAISDEKIARTRSAPRDDNLVRDPGFEDPGDADTLDVEERRLVGESGTPFDLDTFQISDINARSGSRCAAHFVDIVGFGPDIFYRIYGTSEDPADPNADHVRVRKDEKYRFEVWVRSNGAQVGDSAWAGIQIRNAAGGVAFERLGDQHDFDDADGYVLLEVEHEVVTDIGVYIVPFLRWRDVNDSGSGQKVIRSDDWSLVRIVGDELQESAAGPLSPPVSAANFLLVGGGTLDNVPVGPRGIALTFACEYIDPTALGQPGLQVEVQRRTTAGPGAWTLVTPAIALAPTAGSSDTVTRRLRDKPTPDRYDYRAVINGGATHGDETISNVFLQGRQLRR